LKPLPTGHRFRPKPASTTTASAGMDSENASALASLNWWVEPVVGCRFDPSVDAWRSTRRWVVGLWTYWDRLESLRSVNSANAKPPSTAPTGWC